MPRLTPYPRGFVLSRHAPPERSVPGNFHSLEVAGGWHFSFDPLRTPSVCVDEVTGRFVLTHGTCFPVGEESAVDVSAWLLRKLLQSEDTFLDGLDLLAGRHVVVAGDATQASVFQDAAGARSVYYSPGAGLVSSHAHLIHDLVPHEPTLATLRPTGAANTWDLSPWAGIRALVPNHRLVLGTWEVERFFPRQPNRYAGWSTRRKLSAIEAMWQRELDAFTTAFEDVVVSVTGGSDSRVVLAMARRHLQVVHGFTYTPGKNVRSRRSKRLAQDERIVGELRDLLPLDHRFFSRDDTGVTSSPELSQLMSRNSILEHGRWLIPHYNRAFPGDDVMHMRGNAFEIGRAFRDPRPHNDRIEDVRVHYAQRAGVIATDSGTPALNVEQHAYFDGAVQRLGYHEDLHGYHRLDLFHWEFRVGRWLSEVLNETDISFDTFLPVNVRAIFELLLSFDVADRRDGFAYTELIDRNFPLLNFFGKNDDRNLYQQVRDEKRSDLRRKERVNAWLERGLRLSGLPGTPGEEPVSQPAPGPNHLFLPTDRFIEGYSATRVIGHTPVDGSLQFRFRSTYAFKRSLGRFEYRLMVSGQTLLRTDGAAWPYDSWVTVHNLRAEDTIEVQVVALRTMSKESWSRATHAAILDLSYTPMAPEGAPRAVSSNPYADTITWTKHVAATCDTTTSDTVAMSVANTKN